MNVQAAALERQIAKFHRRFWVVSAGKVLGGEVSKSRKKAMGQALTELNKKAGELRSSLASLFEEAMCRKNPMMTPREARREVRSVSRAYDKVIADITKDKLRVRGALKGVTDPGKK